MPNKNKNIYFWGVCDSDGTSWMFKHKPVRSDDESWDALDQSDTGAGESCHVPQNNIFSKDKPQKFQFKIIPVED